MRTNGTDIRGRAPLPTPAQMAAWDRAAIRGLGFKGEMLMENAAREAVRVLKGMLGGSPEGKTVLLFAGPGNNGGDAVCMARLLHCAGARAKLLHIRSKSRFKGESAYHLKLAMRVGVDASLFKGDFSALPPNPDAVVDGLLGTGLSGPLREEFVRLVRGINRLGERAPILALDVPSGLDGLSGRPLPVAVEATATATFQAAKIGLAMPGASAWTGEVHVCDIGIPPRAMAEPPCGAFLLTPKIFSLLPPSPPDMHKGAAGHVLVVGGSPGLAGAPALAARGALRAGAGLATIACPADIAGEAKAGMAETMTMPLGRGRQWTADMAGDLIPELHRFHAAAIGPGLGRDKGAAAFLQALLPAMNLPLVLDADALYWLAEMPELWAQLPDKRVLTPHPGEMARLAGADTRTIQENRLEIARRFAREHDTVLVLKGAGTVVAEPGGTCSICPVCTPNLAVAGSGDVLSGLTASLLARGLAPVEAAELGVYRHARAGKALEERFPGRGNLAGEIADALPAIPFHGATPC